MFKTTNRKFGYNITKGGDGVCGMKHSEETKKILSISAMGNTHRKGVPLTEDHKNKLRGKKHTEETIAKLRGPRSEEQKKKTRGVLRNIGGGKCAQGIKRDGHFSSQYVGVTFYKKDEKWVSRIMHNRERKYLGSFSTEKEAAMAYNEYAWNQWGEDAKLNIIE